MPKENYQIYYTETCRGDRTKDPKPNKLSPGYLISLPSYLKNIFVIPFSRDGLHVSEVEIPNGSKNVI